MEKNQDVKRFRTKDENSDDLFRRITFQNHWDGRCKNHWGPLGLRRRQMHQKFRLENPRSVSLELGCEGQIMTHWDVGFDLNRREASWALVRRSAEVFLDKIYSCFEHTRFVSRLPWFWMMDQAFLRDKIHNNHWEMEIPNLSQLNLVPERFEQLAFCVLCFITACQDCCRKSENRDALLGISSASLTAFCCFGLFLCKRKRPSKISKWVFSRKLQNCRTHHAVPNSVWIHLSGVGQQVVVRKMKWTSQPVDNANEFEFSWTQKDGCNLMCTCFWTLQQWIDFSPKALTKTRGLLLNDRKESQKIDFASFLRPIEG